MTVCEQFNRRNKFESRSSLERSGMNNAVFLSPLFPIGLTHFLFELTPEPPVICVF